jgi:hypothetical protein
MRKPTPVMTMSISALSASSVKSMPTERLVPPPRLIQSQSRTVIAACPAGAPTTLASTRQDTTKDPRIDAVPTMFTNCRPKTGPRKPFSAAPISGNSSTRTTSVDAVPTFTLSSR